MTDATMVVLIAATPEQGLRDVLDIVDEAIRQMRVAGMSAPPDAAKAIHDAADAIEAPLFYYLGRRRAERETAWLAERAAS